MPCTSHQHTSLCISNGWKSPSVSKSPTVNVMKWYQVCTCNVLQYYVCSIYRIRKFGIKVTCSRRLLANRAKRNSLTLDVKRIENYATKVRFFTQKSEKNWKVLETKQVNFGEQVDKWRQVDLRSWCHKKGLLSARTPHSKPCGAKWKNYKVEPYLSCFLDWGWKRSLYGPCI